MTQDTRALLARIFRAIADILDEPEVTTRSGGTGNGPPTKPGLGGG